MIAIRSHRHLLAACALATMISAATPGVLASGEPAPESASKSQEPVASNSVTRLGLLVQPSLFVDNYANGVDPFFPKSKRRFPKTEVIVAAPESADDVPSGRIENLSLKGITGTGAQRLALINNRSFSKDESGSVRIPGGQMQIRVLELGDRSVKIKIEGDPKTHEIKLDDRTYDFTQTR